MSEEVKNVITPENDPIAYTLSVSTPDEVAAIVNNPQIEKASRPTYELTRNVFFVGLMLVSCGGGIVLREENREILKNNGFVVYLQVTAEQAVERVGDVSTRPLFKNLETARKTIEGRLPMYEDAASVAIDTNGKSINMVAQEIQDILEKEGILCLRQK